MVHKIVGGLPRAKAGRRKWHCLLKTAPGRRRNSGQTFYHGNGNGNGNDYRPMGFNLTPFSFIRDVNLDALARNMRSNQEMAADAARALAQQGYGIYLGNEGSLVASAEDLPEAQMAHVRAAGERIAQREERAERRQGTYYRRITFW